MKFDTIRIILVATTHPGNIGSAARAMKTMGLERLYLVSPRSFPDRWANELAAGADDILQNAVVTDTLAEALSGCQLVIGTSARPRDIDLEGLTPAANALRVSQEADGTEVALVFGREHAGLTNDELLLCHYHLHIPSNPDFSSLNLAQAVQIVCYELRMCFLSPTINVKPSKDKLATVDDVEKFYDHLRQIMIDIDFLKPSNPKKLMYRIRRMFHRTQLESMEVAILRGILSQITKTLKPPERAQLSPLYFDYMATTPVDPAVIKAMMPYLGPSDAFGNPASLMHHYGQEAAKAVECARAQIATIIGATVDDLVFTSGATEANNLAILGAARFYQRKGKHLITMSTEHKAVLDSFHQLEQEGFEVTYLNPESDGLLNLAVLEQALRADTILVSVMHVNNEIGVIQDIQAIGELLGDKGILFHVDAAQSASRLAIDLKTLHVDLMSFSAHKNYGPKGIGALYVRHKPRIRLQAQSFGGGQEGGLRAGTLATHQIVGMGSAFALTESVRVDEQTRILVLREKLWAGLKHLPGIQLNGNVDRRIAGILNISFSGIDGADLIPILSELAVSSSSACASSSTQPSYVLRALGVSSTLAKSTLRLSIGRFTTSEHVDKAIKIIQQRILS